MGSGSSKSPQKQDNKENKQVANVNNQDNLNKGQNERDSRGRRSPSPVRKKRSQSPSPVRKNKKKVEEINEKNKQNGFNNNKSSALIFEDDSDFENDIDEVLRIPVAAERSRDEKKKHKSEEPEPPPVRHVSLDRGEEQLPETYAQRLQRKQYMLQQDMLIRQKTIYRNPKEWEMEEEEEPTNAGFDPNKFRMANKGNPQKKEIFTTTVSEDLQTPRYLQSGQTLDEVNVDKDHPSPRRELPKYNQSEQDLMERLENELML